jgi:hypothetical protein
MQVSHIALMVSVFASLQLLGQAIRHGVSRDR